jgi:hypothetical protein
LLPAEGVMLQDLLPTSSAATLDWVLPTARPVKPGPHPGSFVALENDRFLPLPQSRTAHCYHNPLSGWVLKQKDSYMNTDLVSKRSVMSACALLA